MRSRIEVRDDLLGMGFEIALTTYTMTVDAAVDLVTESVTSVNSVDAQLLCKPTRVTDTESIEFLKTSASRCITA